MTVKPKIFLFLLVVFSAANLSVGQTSYTVTSTALGNAGSIDVIIPQAITSANSGQNVTIYFNASGYVQITAQLPQINITAGSITLTKHSQASQAQGLQYASTAGNSAIGYGFYFTNSNSSSITMTDLSVIDFVYNSSANRFGVSAFTTKDVTIKNCVFSNNYGSVVYYRSVNMLIESNTFTNDIGSSIIMSEQAINSVNYNSVIKNNTLTKNSSGSLILIQAGTSPIKHSIKILNNTLSNPAARGIKTETLTGYADDLTLEIEISGNTVTSSINLHMQYPHKHFVVKNNTFTATTNNIILESERTNSNNVFGMNFINSNSVSYTQFNTNNLLLGTPVNSIKCINHFGKNVTIAGYSLPGSISITWGKNTVVRDNSIVSNVTTDKPIDLGLGGAVGTIGNNSIPAPTISTASVSTTLQATYTLSASVTNTNAPYVVDFYKANSTGSLLDYIGSQSISTVTGGTYTANISVPAGVTIGTGERVAATLTSIGTQTAYTSNGTSQAAYYDPDYDISCENCVGSFSPKPGETYLVSTWVKEDGAALTKTTYDRPVVYIEFPGTGTTAGPFSAKGLIIDGWQRIEESFVVPANATSINIKLQCNTGDCYFDDIRFFPKNGSMKTYVYDAVSLRLVAELDERNYATIYEYDEEGKLMRVKKETEKGIMTIQENKNNSSK